MRDNFAPNPTYPENYFWRFQMDTSLFLTIAIAMEKHDDWFKLRRNACREMNVSPLMKCIVVVRLLAYGCLADALDEYARVGEDTILEAV